MNNDGEIERLRIQLARLEKERNDVQASVNAKVDQQRADIVSQINTLVKALEGLPFSGYVDSHIDFGDEQIVYDGYSWSFPSKDGSDWYSSSSDC